MVCQIMSEKCKNIKKKQKIICNFVWVSAAVTLLIICSGSLVRFNNHTDLATTTPAIVAERKNPVLCWHYPLYDFVHTEITENCLVGNTTIYCDIVDYRKFGQKADGYLFFGSGIEFANLPLPRDKKTLWGLVNDESPKVGNEILIYEEALNLFNFSSTFSRHSDVPFPLIWMRSIKNITSKKYFVNTRTKNSLLGMIAPVLFLQTHCNDWTERDAYVRELMKHIPVDSYGLCLNNKKLPAHLRNYTYNDLMVFLTNLDHPPILKFIARYKFMIAIENAVCDDYTTEKLWRTISVGVVPIYFGSPLVRDWLPNYKSAILLQDFPTPELMSQHLNRLLNNDTEYEEYLEHKTKGLISNRRLFDEMEARPYQVDMYASIKRLYCVMCERLHENSTRVNIVTKKHLNCPLPPSALTLSVNQRNPSLEILRKSKKYIDKVYKNLHIGTK